MTETLRVVLTLLVFTAALGGVLLRPRGWNEAGWTVGGAVVLLVTGLVSPGAAWAVTWAGKDVLLFLLALLLLSAHSKKWLFRVGGDPRRPCSKGRCPAAVP